MSEIKEEKKTVDGQKESLIDVNVSLVRAENINLKKEMAGKDELIVKLTKELKQASDLIEDENRSRILAEIRPKVDVPDEYLTKKPLEELQAMKKTLDVARVPAFKSGTPLYVDKKTSPRQELDSMFEASMKKLYGGKVA